MAFCRETSRHCSNYMGERLIWKKKLEEGFKDKVNVSHRRSPGVQISIDPGVGGEEAYHKRSHKSTWLC